MPRARQRLDLLVVERGLASSQQRAQALIQAGQVLVDDRPVDKAGTAVDRDASLRLRGEASRFVSRGGEKLLGGLSGFGVDPTGLVCADLGASTGGFTDCLLQHGAARVYAIDVGYGQLAWSLRQDPRVVVMERVNARHLESLPDPVELVVGDLSFIGLEKVLPAMLRIAGPGAQAVLLIKPQFEVGPQDLAKGGVVQEESARVRAVEAVADAAASLECTVLGWMESPLLGARKGNVEYLLHLAFPLRPPATP